MLPVIFSVFFALTLIYISLYDLKYFRIPDWTVGVVGALGLFRLIFPGFSLTHLYGAVAGFTFLFILHLFFPRGMGFGDVKLAGAIGLFLGLSWTVLAILLSFLSGAVVGILLIALRKKTLKDAVPFGPFLALGAVVALFFGESIIRWYLNLWW
ncbi:MAG TPA: A24 family peptidase [Atribacteraceae bacterium]|nr:A24 family peptidase [Atribacteraceae bacterium]